MSATIQDVAEDVGLSKSTVSRILNRQENAMVSAETKERVFEAVRRLGYQPNRAARALATGRSDLLSIWTPDLRSSYAARILDHIHSAARSAGYGVLIGTTSDSPGWLSHLELLSQWPVDGIIVLDSPFYVDSYRNIRPESKTPIVGIGAYCSSEHSCARLDTYAGGQLAMDELLGMNRTRIAFACDEALLHCHPTDPRLQSYKDAMRNNSLEEHYIALPARTRTDAFSASKEAFESQRIPDAIFCYNDDIAIGIHKALMETGVTIPDEVALVGHDGVIDTGFVIPQITTVSYDYEKMCHDAFRVLSEHIADPESPNKQILISPILLSSVSTRS